MRSRTLLSSILPVLFLFTNSFGQQSPPRPNETGWLLEVTYLKGTPPSYERVRLPGSKMPGDWFARFGRVANWELPSSVQPVHAVRISNRLRGEIVKIRVSVMRGKEYMDTEETVATYELRENEKVTVKPLLNFGVEPFEIRAFRIATLPATQPTAINKTNSVEIIAIEPVASDLPEYKLTLRNLSPKSIDALSVEVLNQGRQLTSGLPQGLEGRPLMLGGETTQVWLPLVVGAALTKDAYAPVVPTQQQFVIKSAIFADGTTEGVTEREIQSGPGFQSVKFGRRLEMQRALPLFAASLESTNAISSDGADRFRAQLEAVNVEVTDDELVDLQRRFPTRDAKALKGWVESGMHFTRKEMLDQLDRFQANAKGKDFRAWLIDNRERYSNWQARLEPTEAPQP
jgi:hypothetical protein